MSAQASQRPPPQEGAADAATRELVKLIGAAAVGDRNAFRALYDATSAKLFGIAVSMLRSRDAAEEVLQEAYLRVWSRGATYDPQRGPPLPWLVGILRKLAINRLNRDRVVNDDIDEYAESLEAIELPIGDRIDAVRCLAALGRSQRVAVVLTYVHGFTNEEVARRMKVPVGTVKSWIRRSALHLRTQFDA